ncbi:MFS transporter [Alteribacillus sp. HJP-4]|uniref:MFS transporter n=1 Tax=Alteribacillus sp. HJP-4 TaxID=2775394 RepID=UPI0035CD2635
MHTKKGILPLMFYLFFAYSLITIMSGYMPIYFQFQGLTQSQIGILMAMGPLASVFAQPFWGYMSDKWKTIKRVLIICVISTLVAALIFFQVTSYPAMMFFLFCLFLFLAPCTALGDSLTQKTAFQHHVNFGSIRMWGSLGFAVTSLITGWILEKWSPGIIYLPFFLCGTAALILVLLLSDTAPAKKPVTIVHALSLGKRPEIVYFLGLVFLISIGHRANDSFLGLFVVELGGGESMIGQAWFVGVVSEAAVFALSALWFRRYPPLIFIIIAGFLYSGRWLIMSTLDDPVHIIWIQILHGITFGLMYFSSLNYISRIIPEELQATGHLLFITTFFGISGITGALAGGWLMENFSGAGLYQTLALFSAAGAALLIFYTLRVRKNTAV